MRDVEKIAATIIGLVRWVEADEKRIGVLSTGERIAVGLVLDRKDFLDGRSMLGAIERLGRDWTEAALLAHRSIDD